MVVRLAATRDASWLNKPGRAARYHVQVPWGAWVASCRAGAVEGPESAGTVLLVETSARPLDEVPEALRCKRAGCREHWPTTGEETQ